MKAVRTKRAIHGLTQGEVYEVFLEKMNGATFYILKDDNGVMCSYTTGLFQDCFQLIENEEFADSDEHFRMQLLGGD